MTRKLSGILAIVLVLGLALSACAAGSDTADNTTLGTQPAGLATEEGALPDTGSENDTGTLPEVSATPMPGINDITGNVQTQTPGLLPSPVATETLEPGVTTAPDTTTAATESATTAPGGQQTAVVPDTGAQDLGRITDLLNRSVQSRDGQEVGQVEDAVLHLGDFTIDYLAVRTTANGGTGRLVAVPYLLFAPETIAFEGQGDATSGQPVTLNVDAGRLQDAPEIDIANLPEATNPSWDSQWQSYWASDLQGLNSQMNNPANNGQGNNNPAANAGILLVSQLMTTNLQNPQGENLGSVQDILFELNTGRVVYIILAPGQAVGAGTQVIPVPAQLLQMDPATGILSLPVEMEQLQQAPTLDLTQVPLDAAGLRQMFDAFWSAFQAQTSPN